MDLTEKILKLYYSSSRREKLKIDQKIKQFGTITFFCFQIFQRTELYGESDLKIKRNSNIANPGNSKKPDNAAYSTSCRNLLNGKSVPKEIAEGF